MDAGFDVKNALKNVVESKLMGTWKMALIATEKPESIFFVKNSGELIIGK